MFSRSAPGRFVATAMETLPHLDWRSLNFPQSKLVLRLGVLFAEDALSRPERSPSCHGSSHEHFSESPSVRWGFHRIGGFLGSRRNHRLDRVQVLVRQG